MLCFNPLLGEKIKRNKGQWSLEKSMPSGRLSAKELPEELKEKNF